MYIKYFKDKENIISLFLLNNAAFINLLLFFEIIYFMFIISFAWGRMQGIIFGTFLLVFLIWQTVGLYSLRELNRKVQLFILDIHFAFSVAFIINRIFVSQGMSVIDHIIFAERLVAAVTEIPLIFFLTSRHVKSFQQGMPKI